MTELLFPILFIPLLLVMLFGLPITDFSNLRPVLQTPPGKILAAIPSLIFNFGGIEVVLFYIGFMKDPGKAYKPVIIGTLFTALFFVMVTAFCTAAYGPKAVTTFIWPLVVYIRKISLPGLFIERLDGVMLSLWILSVFTTMVPAYFVVSYSISKIAGTKEHKQYVLPLVMVIYYLALQPDSLAELYEWEDMIFPYAITSSLFVVPVLLLLTAKLRKLGVNKNENA
jgi:spore germination protein